MPPRAPRLPATHWRTREGGRQVIAPLKQPLRCEMAQRVLPLHADAGRTADAGMAIVACAAGFFCLVPYPALAVGGTSALQIGNVFTLLMVLPIVAMSWSR